MNTAYGPYQYQCHGLGITIGGNDPGLLAAIHARLRPFSTLETIAGDLTIRIDRVSSEAAHTVPGPPGPARAVYETAGGTVLYSDALDQLYLASGDRVRVRCDLRSGYMEVSVRAHTPGSDWLVSHPLLTLPLIEALKRRRRYSLHAAGLTLNGHALLFPGSSGAGKTTLALALAQAGFGFLADDLLFLTPTATGLLVLPFPEELDLTEETVGLFPELAMLRQQPPGAGWPKRPIRVEALGGCASVDPCKPGALIFPQVAHTPRSALAPMPAEEALLTLVPNVLLTEQHSSQAHLDTLGRLVRTTPSYRLETGCDLRVLPALIRNLLFPCCPAAYTDGAVPVPS